MSFITNIRSVAKYESKILVRSWFFRIFTLLAVVFLGFFNFAMMLMEDNFGLVFNHCCISFHNLAFSMYPLWVKLRMY